MSTEERAEDPPEDRAEDRAEGRPEEGSEQGAAPEVVDRQLESAILRLLASRAGTATICPSDAARAVGGEDWRGLMEPARRAARRLVDAGEVVVTQRGEVVDLDAARGPIRIRRA